MKYKQNYSVNSILFLTLGLASRFRVSKVNWILIKSQISLIKIMMETHTLINKTNEIALFNRINTRLTKIIPEVTYQNTEQLNPSYQHL